MTENLFYDSIHNQKALESHEQDSQLFDFFRRGYPRYGPLLHTKVRNQLRILLIGFRPSSFRLTKGHDACGIDDAHLMPGLIQEEGKSIPVGSGGFHAGMHLLNPQLLESLCKRFTSLWGVGKVVGTDVAFGKQMHIEGALGYVNAEGRLARAFRKSGRDEKERASLL